MPFVRALEASSWTTSPWSASRRGLHVCGYEVIEAVNGEAAIAIFEQRHAEIARSCWTS
jgi:hypothetical protein